MHMHTFVMRFYRIYATNLKATILLLQPAQIVLINSQIKHNHNIHVWIQIDSDSLESIQFKMIHHPLLVKSVSWHEQKWLKIVNAGYLDEYSFLKCSIWILCSILFCICWAEQRKDEIEQLIKQRLIRTIDLLIPEIVSIQGKYDLEESRSQEEENKTKEISMGNHCDCKWIDSFLRLSKLFRFWMSPE